MKRCGRLVAGLGLLVFAACAGPVVVSAPAETGVRLSDEQVAACRHADDVVHWFATSLYDASVHGTVVSVDTINAFVVEYGASGCPVLGR